MRYQSHEQVLPNFRRNFPLSFDFPLETTSSVVPLHMREKPCTPRTHT